jgi:hypothetical protein
MTDTNPTSNQRGTCSRCDDGRRPCECGHPMTDLPGWRCPACHQWTYLSDKCRCGHIRNSERSAPPTQKTKLVRLLENALAHAKEHDYQVAGLHVATADLEAGLAALNAHETPDKQWRCFFCDDIFTTQVDAENHFGRYEHAEPACVIKAAGEFALLRALRNAEGQLERYRSEDSDIMRAMASMQSDHVQALRREEEQGYERGVRDAREPPETPKRQCRVCDKAIPWTAPNAVFCPYCGTRSPLEPKARREYHANGTYWSGVPTVDMPCDFCTQPITDHDPRTHACPPEKATPVTWTCPSCGMRGRPADAYVCVNCGEERPENGKSVIRK